VVIGGWRPESTGTVQDRLGAVLVGVPGPGGLRFLGRVGAGLAGRAGDALRRSLSTLALEESPFVTEIPPEDALGARWVHPVLVADVESLGLGHQGRLRQPAFKRLREDLTPDDVDDLILGGE
jgi:bifunctional non-homologous end joining protein LigD